MVVRRKVRLDPDEFFKTIRPMQILLSKLPSDCEWTTEQRDRWLKAFTASLDLAIEVKS